MAEDPIIIDDGGSTRIKRHLRDGIGAMDSLLDVQTDIGGGRPGSQQKIGNDYGETLNIACIKIDGTHVAPLPSPIAFKEFSIESGQHQVHGKVLDGGEIQITVSGPQGNPPVVEARQHEKRRRYIVSNSHRISKVTVKRTSGGDFTFEVGPNVVYTTVVVN